MSVTEKGQVRFDPCSLRPFARCTHRDTVQVRGVFDIAPLPPGVTPGWYPDPAGPFTVCLACAGFSSAAFSWTPGTSDDPRPDAAMRLVLHRMIQEAFALARQTGSCHLPELATTSPAPKMAH